MEVPFNLQEIIEHCWGSVFSKRKMPESIQYRQGGSHHVVLLGDSIQWDLMIRWNTIYGSTYQTRIVEYLSLFEPPVSLPKPLGMLKIDNSETSFYELFIPVNGIPMDQYLKNEKDVAKHRFVGKKLVEFSNWLKGISYNHKFMSRTEKKMDYLYRNKKMCLNRLLNCGVSQRKAERILNMLFELRDYRSDFCVRHSDIYMHHVLIDEKCAIGVIDWDNISLNHQIRDFSFWYEPVANDFDLRSAYPNVWQALCSEYRQGFPLVEEEQQLMLYSLSGQLAYMDDHGGKHVLDWLTSYRKYFDL